MLKTEETLNIECCICGLKRLSGNQCIVATATQHLRNILNGQTKVAYTKEKFLTGLDCVNHAIKYRTEGVFALGGTSTQRRKPI